jgi:hypothetical protein
MASDIGACLPLLPGRPGATGLTTSERGCGRCFRGRYASTLLPARAACCQEPPEVTWPEPEVEDGADDWLRPELLLPELLVPVPELALELPDAVLLLAAAFGEVPDAPLEPDVPDLTELREVLELA